MNLTILRGFFYIAASILFVFGLKMLGSKTTARKGNLVSSLGMLIAILTTLTVMTKIHWTWILVGGISGAVIGVFTAKLVKMTSLPEMVGLFNGFGGLASVLVGWSEFHHAWTISETLDPLALIAIILTIIIGSITFSGSLVAFAKLAAMITGKPILYKNQNLINAAIIIAVLAAGTLFYGLQVHHPGGPTIPAYLLMILLIVLALALGVLSTIRIGGADMPVVICLLNSYSGLAACAAGFVILNNVLIVAGSLVGASGLILTNIMCKAMNRSLANVLFSGFGSTATKQGKASQGSVKPITTQDTAIILEAAQQVVFVPGYGMAAAQAQHVVCELGNLLADNGAEVQYCIHPVAGRMPGHMNVLLAEANVSYELLTEPHDVNPTMETVDVAIVIGANDVVNPAAIENPNSPLWGMPIIDVSRAKICIVLKRSMNPGFAGIDNPLFFKENTRMLFGDAKSSISELVAELKS